MVSTGVNREVVKIIGDWKSDAVDKYLQVEMPTKVRAVQMVRERILAENDTHS